MRRHVHRFTLLIASAVVVAAFGCRDASPTASIIEPASMPAGGATLSRAGAAGHDRGVATQDADANGQTQLLTCTAHGAMTASAVVGPHGGTIAVGNDRLVVPGGALSDTVLITATIPADTLAAVQFSPHGLQFAKAAMLLLSTSGCQTGALAPSHVVYLDGEGDVLQTLDATFNANAQVVTTTIEHFSSYAIAF